MSPLTRKTLLFVILLLTVIIAFYGIAGFLMAGFFTPGFYQTFLSLGPALFIFLAMWQFRKLVLIHNGRIVVDRTQEISKYALCFIFLALAASPFLFGNEIWCIEALVRDIKLLEGKCWYN
ncbi:MAG TPA: hypothetical protein VGE35_02330 [Candidatus Paceibacterota bacterium]